MYVTNTDGSDEFSLDIYVYSKSCWTELANLPTPRNTPVALLLNNRIYLAGNSPDLKFEAYNLETGKWEEKADLPTFNWEYPGTDV